MKTAKILYQSIKVEDNLPSEAGVAFRRLVSGWTNTEPKRLNFSNLGYRELGIIADWIKYFCEMPATERDIFINRLENE